jgi:hypothetical protein
MAQSATGESVQAEVDATGTINAPIANTTANTFINRNMAEKVNDSESEVNLAAKRAGKITVKRLLSPDESSIVPPLLGVP